MSQYSIELTPLIAHGVAGHNVVIRSNAGASKPFFVMGDKLVAELEAKKTIARMPTAATSTAPKAAQATKAAPKAKPEIWERNPGESAAAYGARLAETAARLAAELRELQGASAPPASRAAGISTNHALNVAMNLAAEPRGIVSTASKLSFNAVTTPQAPHSKEKLRQQMLGNTSPGAPVSTPSRLSFPVSK